MQKESQINIDKNEELIKKQFDFLQENKIDATNQANISQKDNIIENQLMVSMLKNTHLNQQIIQIKKQRSFEDSRKLLNCHLFQDETLSQQTNNNNDFNNQVILFNSNFQNSCIQQYELQGNQSDLQSESIQQLNDNQQNEQILNSQNQQIQILQSEDFENLLNENEIKELSEQMEMDSESLRKTLKIIKEKNYGLSEVQNPKDPSKVLDRYLLGKGSQAYVLKGIQIENGEQVAIKISNGNKETYDEMVREQEVISRIKCHQFIIQVYEQIYIQDISICVQVMELCTKSLMDEIEEKKNTNTEFSEDELLVIFNFAFQSLIEIHLNDIIHFDIKPQNILKTSSGLYKLSDFGLSKSLHFKKDLTNEVSGGTYLYCSPEQMSYLEKQQIDPNYIPNMTFATDIFSMGLSLLQVLVVNMGMFQFLELKQGDFTKIDKQINKKFQKFYCIIRYYMLLQQPELRLRSYLLREFFLYSVLHNNAFKEKERQRIAKVIELYQLKGYPDDKNLAFQYIYLSTLDLSENGIMYAYYAYEIIKLADLLNTTYGSYILKMLSMSLQGHKNDSAIEYEEQSIETLKKYFPECHYEIAHFTHLLGKSYLNICQYQKGKDCLTSSLKVKEELLPQNHPDIVQIIQLLADVKIIENVDLEQALETHLKCLKLNLSIFGDRHPQVFISLNSISQYYVRKQQYECALEYFLKIHENFLVDNLEIDKDWIFVYSQLGDLYRVKGDYKKSVEFYIQSLNYKKNIYGKQSKEIDSDLNHLAMVYQRLKEYEKSLENFFELLKLRQNSYFEDKDEKIFQVFYNIALLYKEKQDWEQFLLYLEKKYEILQNKLKHKNNFMINCLFEIIQVCNYLKKYNLAIYYFSKTQEQISQNSNKQYESEIYNDISKSFTGVGNDIFAFEYKLKTLKIREALYKDSADPKLAKTYSDIGFMYLTKNELDNAKKSYFQSFVIYQALYEKFKTDSFKINIADSLMMIARICYQQKDFIQAKDQALKSLNIRESISEEYDKTIAANIRLFNDCAQQCNDYQAALLYEFKLLKMLTNKYPGNNIEVAQQLINVAKCYECLKYQEQTMKFYENGLAVFEAIHPPDHDKILEIKDKITYLKSKCTIF